MKRVLVVTAILALTICNSALADKDGEKEALVRLISEIDNLSQSLEIAEQQSPSNTRHTFDYDLLRADLQKVRAGVTAYLLNGNTGPRVNEFVKTGMQDTPPVAVEPVVGDYMR